jgi:hypothetical protein
MNRAIPERLNWQALDSDAESEGDRVAGHPSHGYFNHEAKMGSGEDAEVQEEDGEFGDILNESVEDLTNIVELKTSATTS